MRNVNLISGHPISIGFHWLTCCQRDPWDRGVIATPSLLSRVIESQRQDIEILSIRDRVQSSTSDEG